MTESDAVSFETWLLKKLSALSEPPRQSDDVKPHDRLRDDLGVDSLAFIELMVSFERKFDLRLDEGDLLPGRYQTVGDLLDELEKYDAGPRTA
ncbi:acyl carrier protein [Streptomyces sp. NPDC001073]